MVNIEHLEWLSKLSRKEFYDLLEKALAELNPIELLQKQAEESRQEACGIREKGEKDKKAVKEVRNLSMFYLIIFIITIPFSILIYYSYKKKLNKMEEKINQQINDVLIVANQCENKAQDKRNNVVYLPAVPKGYCYSLALETMIEIIANGRANTWQELADRYEEQYHRWTLEEMSRKKLEAQIRQAQATEETLQQARKAANWAAIGAIGSWTTAAGVWSRR